MRHEKVGKEKTRLRFMYNFKDRAVDLAATSFLGEGTRKSSSGNSFSSSKSSVNVAQHSNFLAKKYKKSFLLAILLSIY